MRKFLHVALIIASTLFLAGGYSGPASGQVIVPFEPGNKVSVTVASNVAFDSGTGLYTYSYVLTSASTSQQEIWHFAIQFQGVVTPEVLNPRSPEGWTFNLSDSLPLASWAATGGPVPSDFVDDGAKVPPSPFQIKPGQTLGGFSFQSHDPPDNAQFFAQGFTQLPSAVDAGDVEDELSALGIRDFRDESFGGTTVGPKTLTIDEAFLGGRRPSVDGFLVFLNIAEGDTRNAPVAIVVKFSFSGEVVDRSTFHAQLNGEDVTAAFQPSNPPGDMTAVFSLGSSPLKQGRNVLLTSVQGIVPGTSRTATDTDRLTFTVP